MRELVLISYHFPPMGGSGVQRALKLAKYLPDAGWHAHVIHAGHEHYPVMDPALLQEVRHRYTYPTPGFEAGGLAARIRALVTNSSRLRGLEDRLYWRLDRCTSVLPLPEKELLWTPAATARARSLIRSHPIEAIVTTSPPHCTHLVGRAIKRRTGIPLIADLRDPIVDNFAADTGSAISRAYHSWIERIVVRDADRIIVTCPELADRLASRYGQSVMDRITTIPNGYDPDDAQVVTPSRSGRFTLAHVGSFYRQQSIEPILIALRRLQADRADTRGRLVFKVVGSLSVSQRQLLREFDAEFMTLSGYCAHADAVAEMTRADALLLTVPACDGGRCCIPAKTFEYLAFGGHVISYAHAGTALSGILRQAGGTTIFHDPSPDAWRQAIETCYDAWQRGCLDCARSRAVVEQYRRDDQARRFARVVERCAGGETHLRLPASIADQQEAA